ncbi:MAG TPA: ROK family protein, partial [Desulfuromonadaceae bacterium]
MARRCILGFDVGGTKTAVVAGRADGSVLARRAFPTGPERGAEAVVGQMEATARQLLREAGYEPAAVSVSIGGPLDVLNGVIKSPPNLPGWNQV